MSYSVVRPLSNVCNACCLMCVRVYVTQIHTFFSHTVQSRYFAGKGCFQPNSKLFPCGNYYYCCAALCCRWESIEKGWRNFAIVHTRVHVLFIYFIIVEWHLLSQSEELLTLLHTDTARDTRNMVRSVVHACVCAHPYLF